MGSHKVNPPPPPLYSPLCPEESAWLRSFSKFGLNFLFRVAFPRLCQLDACICSEPLYFSPIELTTTLNSIMNCSEAVFHSSVQALSGQGLHHSCSPWEPRSPEQDQRQSKHSVSFNSIILLFISNMAVLLFPL